MYYPQVRAKLLQHCDQYAILHRGRADVFKGQDYSSQLMVSKACAYMELVKALISLEDKRIIATGIRSCHVHRT